jgi:hypothetical protein
MIFDTPLPFSEALAARAVRVLLPTELRTKDLAALEPALRQRALFSAGVTNADFLGRTDSLLGDLLDGKINRADARQALKEQLGSLGADVDEADLTDLRSDARLNLILDTNLQQAQGYGQFVQGSQPDVLDQWPAQELVRVIDSLEPRDWAARWAAAGGQFFGGRMIALKSDPVWSAISRFGTPYPPFDFNSGMDVQDIDRAECEEIGLLSPEDEVTAPEIPDFNSELQASPQIRADWLRTALADTLQGLAKFDAQGVLRFLGGAA